MMNQKEMAELITKELTKEDCSEERRKEILDILFRPLKALDEESLRKLEKEVDAIIGDK